MVLGPRFKPKIEWLAVDRLIVDPRNPRKHSDLQVKQIGRSITAFGFIFPVVVDRKNKILAGHARVRACRLLGITDIPTIRVTHLTEAQARALAIADNRLTENSTWDDRLLGEIFRDLLADTELDFSVEATGFSMGEIDLTIENLNTPALSGPDPDDAVPEISNLPPVTRPGDLWILGRHRVLCGNALAGASYDAVMDGGAQAQLVFSDPPYNVPIEGHVSGKGRTHHREFPMASGEMNSDEFVGFLTAALCLMAKHSTDGSLHYLFMDWGHLSEILTAGSRAYSEFKNLCIWVKNNAGMGSLYRSRHELVLLFKNGRAPHRNNIQLGRFGRNRTNVWEYPGVTGLNRIGEEGNLAELHPTPKPVALVADAILDASERGDLVLDPFLGSGTTLIAAERVGRACRAIELDPRYVDAAIRRWQRHTGDRAVHAESGRSFDDLAAESGATNG